MEQVDAVVLTERFKRVVRRHWPRLRLRTILLATFLFVAALPGFGALFLRVYENSLIRQTEAELVAQSVALAAVAAVTWSHDAQPAPPSRSGGQGMSIDLRMTPVLPGPPAPEPGTGEEDRRGRDWAYALRPILRLTSDTTQASILLLDGTGRILIGPLAGGSYVNLPEVRATLGGRPMTTLRRDPTYRPGHAFEWLGQASGLRIHHARPIVAGGEVVGVLLLSRSPQALFSGMYEDRGKIALGVGLILSTLIVLSGLLSRGIVRPVEALGMATRAVARGGGPVPAVPTTAAIEIQALYRDFGVMAEAIERRSRYLRDFAHAISHEFKTPLAGIGGAVELLQDHPDMSPADRDRFLGSIGEGAARLSQLVSRLLDLARADMAEMVDGAAADLTVAVRRIADAFASADFEIIVEGDNLLPPVAAPPPVIETVLVGLVENSRQAGASRVHIETRRMGGSAEIVVRDNGPGIIAGDRMRIFEPFFTSRRATGGTGLGLPIIRSLLAAHRGTVDLAADTGKGATFAITFPLYAACSNRRD